MLDQQPEPQDSAAPPDRPAGLGRDRARPANEPPERPRRTRDGTAAHPPPQSDLGPVRAVIDALPEAVFVTESDGGLRLTNPAADRLFAGQPVHDRADLLSRFEEVVPQRRPRRTTTQPAGDPVGQRTVRPRHQPNRWFTLRTVDIDPSGWTDRDAVADGTSRPAPEGDTVFVLRDITDSRELQPFREAFLSVLSHELRTPITTIYAGSSVLVRRPELSPPATQSLVRDISSEAARLYDLVEDLLVLARLERGVLDPLDEPVLVQRSVDATIRTVRDRVGDAPIVRRADPDIPPVHGDATYVEQACRNLILGSIRYAGPDPDRALVVEVRSLPDDDEVAVLVQDRGPGLAPDELDRAFELPHAGVVGRLTGSGIGPFVCRHLVEAMGGRVWARNREGGGLEMGFALGVDARD
jgi:signal transduction histidine kinase